MGELAKLKGIGPQSEKRLNAVGIHSHSDLLDVGAVGAYFRLKARFPSDVSLNFLYAMVGALEGVHWSRIAREERTRLLAELDGYSRIRDDIERNRN